MNQELKYIGITRLVESATNPRRRFDEQKMAEMADSIRQNGVLVPLLVRPINETPAAEKNLENLGLLNKKSRGNGSQRYEILAGARRFRAAKEANCTELPVIIKSVNDDEALEIQLFENEQREDVHPLEQAIGYKQWIDRPGHTISGLAAKMGCSESHVYKRLKLLDLIPPAQEAFLEDRIAAEHAILIARLQPKDQEKAFAQCFDKYRNDQLISAKSLSDWIEFEIHLDLKGAPFKLVDQDLLPSAGSCINCPKRTGFNAALFPDIRKKDTCTDGACFKKKVQAHINQTIAQQEGKGKELLKVTTDWSGKKDGPLPRSQYHPIQGKEDSCEHARKAIVVSGRDGKGKVITVCVDPACKIHKKQQTHSLGRSSQADYEKREKERKEKAKQEQLIREEVFAGIRAKAKDSDWMKADWQLIALSLLDHLDFEAMLRIAKDHEWTEVRNYDRIKKIIEEKIPSFPMEELMPLIVELCIVGFVDVSPYQDLKRPKLFRDTALRFNVDVKAIEKRLAGELRREKKAKDSKGSPKKATKGKARKKETAEKSPNLSCDNQCDSCKRDDCPVKGWV